MSQVAGGLTTGPGVACSAVTDVLVGELKVERRVVPCQSIVPRKGLSRRDGHGSFYPVYAGYRRLILGRQCHTIA
jgi:hypothetical protein